MSPIAELSVASKLRLTEFAIKKAIHSSQIVDLNKGITEKVYYINNEPLVIRTKDYATAESKSMVICSENLARELKGEGIVIFSESPQEETVPNIPPPDLDWLGHS